MLPTASLPPRTPGSPTPVFDVLLARLRSEGDVAEGRIVEKPGYRVLRKFPDWAGAPLKDCNRGLKAYARRQGGNAAPSQNPAPINVSGTTTLDPGEFGRNGNTAFSVITEEPESVIPGAPDCPNTNWTETIDDLLFTSASITVEQPEGTAVLAVDCTFDPPASDGPVPKCSVTCTVP